MTVAKPIPERTTSLIDTSSPLIPTTKTVHVKIRFLELLQPNFASTNIHNTMTAIIQNNNKEKPTITETGIEEIRVVNLPLKAKIIASIVAPPITQVE